MLIQNLWRPYRVKCTGSLPTSEDKWRRTRLLLGWGTARENLRVPPTCSISLFVAWPCFILLICHIVVISQHFRHLSFGSIWRATNYMFSDCLCELMLIVRIICLDTKPASWNDHLPVHAARCLWNTAVAVIDFAAKYCCLPLFLRVPNDLRISFSWCRVLTDVVAFSWSSLVKMVAMMGANVKKGIMFTVDYVLHWSIWLT